MKSGIWDSDRSGKPVLTESWMEERWWLFETFCFPSIVNQTNQDFTWLIYFDHQTPEYYRTQLDELRRAFPRIIPFYVDSYEAFESHLRNWLSENGEAPYIITSRLDNDDALHKEAVAEIQKRFSSQDYQAVNLTRGYCYLPPPKPKLTVYDYPRGPFLSLIEKKTTTGEPLTVFHRQHTDFLDHTMVMQVDHEPFWVQIIHASNLSNGMRGRPILNHSNLSDFGIIPGPHQKFVPFLYDFAAYLYRKIT